MSLYQRIVSDGSLIREAAKCRTAAELAARFGVTADGLNAGLARLRRSGKPVPLLADLLAKTGAVGQQRAAGRPTSSIDEPPFLYPDPELEAWGDGWDDKTSPGMPSFATTAVSVADECEATANVRAEESSRGQEPDPVEEHRLKRKVRDLEERNKWLVEALAKAQDQYEVMQSARAHSVPPITPREQRSGLREGTAVAMLSDLHIEEVVRPEQVQGLNAFNIDIARQRMTRFFEGTRSLIEHNRGMFQIRDLVLPLMGDLISGHIHEDLAESTALGPPQAIAFAQQVIADGIHYMLRDPKLERIVVPCVDGNHGRLTVKMRIATRIGHSLEWLCYAQLAREFQHEPRVQFILPESELVYYDVYDRTLRIMHGDRVQYGGGVGGITIPLSKVISRLDTSRRAYMTMLGHFHTLQYGMNYISNGSLIGYGPFSQAIAAPFEWPAQAFFVVDSKRGRCQMTPVWVGDASEQRAAA